ncbi:hypothetical protein [Lampropedia puyangensis]|nr:hypothetical protein [Lampropedia puyangensis]
MAESYLRAQSSAGDAINTIACRSFYWLPPPAVKRLKIISTDVKIQR